MNIAAIIIGIDNWEQYTLPLLNSIWKCDGTHCVVVDNASETPYPIRDSILRTERLCYSAAINAGKRHIDFLHNRSFDWYIVLSNDVLCTGPFAHVLAEYGNEVVGPRLTETHGFPYIEGWCVAIPAAVWDAVGGWDERFQGSDWEDVAFSTAARQRGFWLVEDLPFVHLDQKQRFTIVDDFWAKDAHNRDLFMREYGKVTA